MAAHLRTLDLDSVPLDIQLSLASWCLQQGLATARELVECDDRLEREYRHDHVDVWCTLSRAFSDAAIARRG